MGAPIPCSDAVFGVAGDDGCYYKAVAVTAAQAAAYGGAGKGPGTWYDQTCPGTLGTGVGLVWRPDAAGPAAALPAPAVLARRAVATFRLSGPVIGASPGPGITQLVFLPTWLWIEPAGWVPQSATAAVPGRSVTATATPTEVVWTMGDGSTVRCLGPGTVFPVGGDPRVPSPDCGHTYTRSSANRPGSAFAVTATMSWSITWTGGGEQGVLAAMHTTNAVQLRVGESQSLIVGGNGAG